MSVVCASSEGWVLNHFELITKLYSDVTSCSDKCTSYAYEESLFKIITPFLFTSQSKKSTSNSNSSKNNSTPDKLYYSDSEVTTVRKALHSLVSLAKANGEFDCHPSIDDFDHNNQEAREYSSDFFSKMCNENITKLNGGNTAPNPILVNIQGENYIIPNNSYFHLSQVQELQLPDRSQFDLVLLDPPWWNKYIRRRKRKHETSGYKMMYNEEVCSLPLKSWLAPSALVAVWCTNCPRHIEDVKTHWFPTWGLTYIATWYWIKVTLSGEPVCKFSKPPGKQPYERILFGAAEGRIWPQPPPDRCIVSVPSAVHSHKPPLCEVLKPYLPPEPRSLELFARYLLPNYTSVGDQVLTLQNVKLFTQIEHTTT